MNPDRKCAAIPAAAAVANVPATPIHAVAAATGRNLRHPICMPPSNKIRVSATVTPSSTVTRDRLASRGQRLAAAAAASRKKAGAGISSRWLIRLDRAATMITAAAARTTAPNNSTPLMA